MRERLDTGGSVDDEEKVEWNDGASIYGGREKRKQRERTPRMEGWRSKARYISNPSSKSRRRKGGTFEFPSTAPEPRTVQSIKSILMDKKYTARANGRISRSGNKLQ